MEIFKRFRKRLIIILVICIIAGFGYIREATVPANSKPVSESTIIIDPGHGGFDGGAGADDGTLEKDINLKIALKTYDILRLYGYNVILTHSEDIGTEDDSSLNISSRKKSDLRNRLELMSATDNSIYVSIHLNKFTTSAASGAQVFYTPNFEKANILGKYVQEEIVSLLQPENHRCIKPGTDSTFLLKNATVPAIIVECGFLSNPSDLKQLKDNDYQKSMAFCIANGIEKYYNSK